MSVMDGDRFLTFRAQGMDVDDATRAAVAVTEQPQVIGPFKWHHWLLLGMAGALTALTAATAVLVFTR